MYYNDKQTKYASSMDRLQFHILPEQTCLMYVLQSNTSDPIVWARWNMPAQIHPELKWLIIYVMLSRVRGLDCLVSSGLNENIMDIIEKNFCNANRRLQQDLRRENQSHTTNCARWKQKTQLADANINVDFASCNHMLPISFSNAPCNHVHQF